MKGLIVSSNPLFTEVVSQALVRYLDRGCVLIDPRSTTHGFSEHAPDLILVDDSMAPELLSKTLHAARQLRTSQTVLINPGSNDCQVVRSYFTTIANLEEFMSMMVAETAAAVDGTPADAPEGAMQAAGIRSEMYNFLAAVLNQRPDADFVDRLREVGEASFLRALEVEGLAPQAVAGIEKMAAFVRDSAPRSAAEVELDLAVDWTRLFRGVQPGYGPPPPYEAEYRQGVRDANRFLQLLRREYASFGASLDASAGNRPDYLGLELAFLSFLASNEAEKWKAGEDEEARSLAGGANNFLHNHLGAWVGAYCEKALPEARTDFYRGYLMVLQSILNA